MAKAVAVCVCPECGKMYERQIEGYNRADANSKKDYAEHCPGLCLEHGSADMETPNKETLDRWKVNFIRHNLCEYDDSLTALFGLVGKDSLYYRLKAETLSKIAEVYPELKAECMRQMKA